MSTSPRIALPDGRWFDPSRATVYPESTSWDGGNHVSHATGSPWNHEELFHTPSGAWIIHSWSQWQGTLDSHEIISAEEAVSWLIANNHPLPASLEGLAARLEA